MAEFLRLKSHIGYQVAEAGQVFVSSETSTLQLRGRAFAVLLPLLREGVAVSDLLQEPPAALPVTELAYALHSLRQHNLLNDFTAPLAEGNAIYWDSLGVNAVLATSLFLAASVRLRDYSATPAVAMQIGQLLHAQGINCEIWQQTTDAAQTVPALPAVALEVVLVDDYIEQSQLPALNADFHARRQPWFLAKPGGNLIWLGPFFVSGQGACWQCMQQRMHSRRKLQTFLQARQLPDAGKQSIGAQTQFSCAHAFAAAAISAEISKFLLLQTQPSSSPTLTQALPSLHQLLTIDINSYQSQTHTITRRPQCPVCGNAQLIAQQQMQPLAPPASAANTAVRNREAGLRSQSAEQIVQMLASQISPICGIIGHTQTFRLPDDDSGLALSVAAEHNFALIDDTSSFLQERVRACAGGKGRTEIQARASALCESIERYSGAYHGDEKCVLARMSELPDAIAPNEIMLFSPAQYAQREQSNRNAARFAWVPEPFDPHTHVAWTPLWSMTQQRFFYLPSALCFYGYARQHGCQFGKADSNGCAAGSSLYEAMLQGFLELVERDAAAIWWYRRSRKCGVVLDSFADPWLQQVQRFHAGAGRKFWVLDISSDLGVPCFAALCARQEDGGAITYAFGAHFDASIALQRAVSELHQILPNLLQGTHQQLHTLGLLAAQWWQQAKLDDLPYLLPDESLRGKELSDYAPAAFTSIEQALQACLDIAQQHDLNFLVLNQTRPDTGLAVAKVLVPSLRHFWPRFAQGRLYGDGVVQEAALNPWPIFI